MEKNNICKKSDFLDACKNKNDYDCEFLNDAYMSENVAYQLEGFLFPATYDLAENSKASDVVATMLETFAAKSPINGKAIVMKTVCRFMSL